MYKKRAAQPSSFIKILLFIGGVFLLIFLGLYGVYRYISYKHMPHGRYSLVLFGDPVEIASYEPVTKQWSIIQFPVSTTIRGVRGFGDYRLEGLWKLAATEATPSGVVLESITDEFGIPVDRYLSKIGSPFQAHTSPLIQEVAGITGVLRYASRTWEHTLPWTEFLALSQLAHKFDQGMVHIYRLEEGKGLSEKVARDGTVSQMINREVLDTLTSDSFEDISMRKDRLRVAIYNTTGQPSLGSRVARILSKMGANVVSVGNDSKEITGCIMSGQKTILATYTAQNIAGLFSCTPEETSDIEQGDITLKIGTDYAKKFIKE